MGMPGPCSRSSYDEPRGIKYFQDPKVQEVYTDLEKVKGNPDPTRFYVIKALPVGTYLVAVIKYPDAISYEGVKVLVYEDLTEVELRRFTTIDPHFSDSKKYKSPIARFVPTNDGWDMALHFCAMMLTLKDVPRI